MNKAIDSGINFVDTADCYGDSEEKIGRALRGRREEFYLSTKIDERDGLGVRNKLERCLHRLGTDRIDLVFFHDVRGSEYERIFDSGGLEVLEKARELGDNFVRLLKDTAKAEPDPGGEIGAGVYDYTITVTKPDKVVIARGSKASTAAHITW